MSLGESAKVTEDFKAFNWSFAGGVKTVLQWKDLTTNMLFIGHKGVVTPIHYGRSCSCLIATCIDVSHSFGTIQMNKKTCLHKYEAGKDASWRIPTNSLGFILTRSLTRPIGKQWYGFALRSGMPVPSSRSS